LEKRLNVVRDGDEWFQIPYAISYWQEFERSKIILGRFMDKPTFAFDRQQFFHNDALYMISGVDEYVVAILNSSVSWWFLRQICTDLQNGYLQAFRKDLFQIPIPPATDEEKKAIETLVQKCLDAQGTNVAPYEAEIEAIVVRLYGLTELERSIVEGKEG